MEESGREIECRSSTFDQGIAIQIRLLLRLNRSCRVGVDSFQIGLVPDAFFAG